MRKETVAGAIIVAGMSASLLWIISELTKAGYVSGDRGEGIPVEIKGIAFSKLD